MASRPSAPPALQAFLDRDGTRGRNNCPWFFE